MEPKLIESDYVAETFIDGHYREGQVMQSSLFASVAVSAMLALSGAAFAQTAQRHEPGVTSSSKAGSEIHKPNEIHKPKEAKVLQSHRRAAAANEHGSVAQSNRVQAPRSSEMNRGHAAPREKQSAAETEKVGGAASLKAKHGREASRSKSATTRLQQNSAASVNSSATHPEENAKTLNRGGAASSSSSASSAMRPQGDHRVNRAAEVRGARNKEANREDAGSKSGGLDRSRLSEADQKRVVDSIRAEHVKDITHARFSVRIGAVVPTRYEFYPLPTEIVTIYPQYRGDKFVMVNDEIVIVEPRTHRIVRTIDEYRTAAMNEPARDCR